MNSKTEEKRSRLSDDELAERFSDALRDAGICLYPDEEPDIFDWKAFRYFPDPFSAERLLRSAVAAAWRIGRRVDWNEVCADPKQNALYWDALLDALIPLQVFQREDRAYVRRIEEGGEEKVGKKALAVEAIAVRGIYHWLKQMTEWYPLEVPFAWIHKEDCPTS